MEAIEKNNASNTHQEKAKKLRKLRRWQIAVSLLGAAIVVWGIVEVACLFLGYNRTETSNDAQIEQYISPINLRASGYIKKIYFTEHQEVHKGDTLLVLDDRTGRRYRNRGHTANHTDHRFRVRRFHL